MSLSVSGTVLPREGKPPLFAVTTQLGDHVVQASLIDPEHEPELYAQLMGQQAPEPS